MQQTLSESAQTCNLTSYFIGICFLIGLIRSWQLFSSIFSSFWLRPLNLQKRYGGGWALVTGGSEGIGLAIASQLAKQHLNLILVSRSAQKLRKAREQLLKIEPQIIIQYKSVDFSALTTPYQYTDTFKDILNKDISVLVNNVGYHLPHKMLDNSFEEIRTQMKVNLLPIAVLSRMLTQNMLKRNSKSAIINLSSSSALTSFKGCSNYSATKTFDDFISQCMDMQFSSKIDILNVRPFLVTTAMTQNLTAFTFTNAEGTAKEIIKQLGKNKVCYGPFLHRVQGAFTVFVNSQSLTGAIYSKQFGNVQKMYEKKCK